MVTPAVSVLVQMTKILAETAGVELMNKLWGDDDGAKVYQELQNLNAEMKQMFDEEFDINNIKDAQKHIHTITHYLNHNIPNYKAPQQDGTVLSNEQIYNQIINVDRFDSEQHVRDTIMSPLEISSIPVAAIDNYILGNNLYIIFCQELAKLDPNNPTWAGKVSEQAKTAHAHVFNVGKKIIDDRMGKISGFHYSSKKHSGPGRGSGGTWDVRGWCNDGKPEHQFGHRPHAHSANDSESSWRHMYEIYKGEQKAAIENKVRTEIYDACNDWTKLEANPVP